jgi:hypothetical protein
MNKTTGPMKSSKKNAGTCRVSTIGATNNASKPNANAPIRRKLMLARG